MESEFPMGSALPPAAVCLLFMSCAALAQEKPKLPEAPGKTTTVKLCGTCHAAEIVMSRRESREGWSGVVEDMIQRGLKGSEEDFGEVVDYLVANFPRGAPLPKVNVNKAGVADLVAALGIQGGQAAAIVKYRDENGKYKSVEDVLKVPGINTSSIEAKKNRLEF
jgi:competence protein ComEA